jgi:hypothetical protein
MTKKKRVIDRILLKYEENCNVTASKKSLTMHRIGLEVKGLPFFKLKCLKKDGEMWYSVLERVLNAGIDALFEENPEKTEEK